MRRMVVMRSRPMSLVQNVSTRSIGNATCSPAADFEHIAYLLISMAWSLLLNATVLLEVVQTM